MTGLFLQGVIFGGANKRREVCVSKSARLILGGKFASQNRLGLFIVEKIFVSNLEKVLTETRAFEDVDLSKKGPYKYFVHMDRGNQDQE